MLQALTQVMLYCQDTDACAEFWCQKMNFTCLDQFEGPGGKTSYTLAPAPGSQMQLVLHNKDGVAAMATGVNLATPSILFSCQDIDQTHAAMTQQDIRVNAIMTAGQLKTFSFADPEGNHFAIQELKQA